MTTIVSAQSIQTQPGVAGSLPCPPATITLNQPSRIVRCIICGAPIVGSYVAWENAEGYVVRAHPSNDDCVSEAQLLAEARLPERPGDRLMLRRARLMLPLITAQEAEVAA